MTSEAEKGKVEISIFKLFAAAAGLNYESVEKQSPEEGKPDLKCIIGGEETFFELTEACSEDVAKALSSVPPNVGNPESIRIKDYTSETYKKKISKRYNVKAPIELLIYNVGRTILSDDVLIKNIRTIAEKNKGQFRKVWYFNQQAIEI
mgnify:CR=1 FL=1